MTETERPRLTAGELTTREKKAAVAQGVVLVGSIPDLVVALVRFARRDRGVQLGPTLTTVGLATVTPDLVRWSLRLGGRPGMAVRVALLVAAPVLPAVAGVAHSTVVGTRNPLWQLAVSGAVRVLSACFVALPAGLAIARRQRAAAELSGA